MRSSLPFVASCNWFLRITADVVGGGSYYIDDTLIEAELQAAYDYYYSSLGSSCNYTDYVKVMVPFWSSYFERPKLHSSPHLDRIFNLQFPGIYVAFDEEFGETEKILYTYLEPFNSTNLRIGPITVNKTVQRQLEFSRCFTGGPIVCSPAGKCICMNKTEWIETVLMDDVSGAQLVNQDPVFQPNGRAQACGVKLGHRCYRPSFALGKMRFDCVGYEYCHESLNICVPKLKYGKKNRVGVVFQEDL